VVTASRKACIVACQSSCWHGNIPRFSSLPSPCVCTPSNHYGNGTAHVLLVTGGCRRTFRCCAAASAERLSDSERCVQNAKCSATGSATGAATLRYTVSSSRPAGLTSDAAPARRRAAQYAPHDCVPCDPSVRCAIGVGWARAEAPEAGGEVRREPASERASGRCLRHSLPKISLSAGARARRQHPVHRQRVPDGVLLWRAAAACAQHRNNR
jgi:hypothetical protein